MLISGMALEFLNFIYSSFVYAFPFMSSYNFSRDFNLDITRLIWYTIQSDFLYLVRSIKSVSIYYIVSYFMLFAFIFVFYYCCRFCKDLLLNGKI